jgi:hypothetical protein
MNTEKTYHEAVTGAHEILKSGKYNSVQDVFQYATADLLVMVYGVTREKVFADLHHLREQHEACLKKPRKIAHQQANEERRLANLQKVAQ